jgi:hypothetical protein
VLAFSLGDFLWSLFVIFFMVVYFLMLFQVIIDLFRRPETSGWKKAAWVLFLIFLPLIGLISYLIVNAGGMAERGAREVQRSQQQFDDYVRDVSGGGSASEIARAKELLDSGAITQAEFEQLKAKALAA